MALADHSTTTAVAAQTQTAAAGAANRAANGAHSRIGAAIGAGGRLRYF